MHGSCKNTEEKRKRKTNGIKQSIDKFTWFVVVERLPIKAIDIEMRYDFCGGIFSYFRFGNKKNGHRLNQNRYEFQVVEAVSRWQTIIWHRNEQVSFYCHLMNSNSCVCFVCYTQWKIATELPHYFAGREKPPTEHSTIVLSLSLPFSPFLYIQIRVSPNFNTQHKIAYLPNERLYVGWFVCRCTVYIT